MTLMKSRTESQLKKPVPSSCNNVARNSKHQFLSINLILVTGGN